MTFELKTVNIDPYFLNVATTIFELSGVLELLVRNPIVVVVVFVLVFESILHIFRHSTVVAGSAAAHMGAVRFQGKTWGVRQ